MTAFNVVRFRVKPGMDQVFLDAHRDGKAAWPGMTRGFIINTGERTYVLVGEWPDATAEDGRKRVVSNSDPIYGVNLREFVAGRLRDVIGRSGGLEVFQAEWLSRIDEAVVKGFVELKLL